MGTDKDFSQLTTPEQQEAAYNYRAYFRPALDGGEQPYVGDTMPFYEDGVYYIYLSGGYRQGDTPAVRIVVGLGVAEVPLLAGAGGFCRGGLYRPPIAVSKETRGACEG
mgnify:CR=1 FL=1